MCNILSVNFGLSFALLECAPDCSDFDTLSTFYMSWLCANWPVSFWLLYGRRPLPLDAEAAKDTTAQHALQLLYKAARELGQTPDQVSCLNPLASTPLSALTFSADETGQLPKLSYIGSVATGPSMLFSSWLV